MKPRKAKQERLYICLSADEKILLKRAAQKRQLSLNQFVLQASLAAASEIQSEESALQNEESQAAIVVSAEEYEWLLQLLEEPPRELPYLRRLLAEEPVWNVPLKTSEFLREQ